MSLDYNYGKIKGFVKATDTETSRIEGYPNRKDEWLVEAIPKDRRKVYKSRKIIETVFDKTSFIEFGKNTGKSVVAGLARLDGWPVGVLASDPYFYGGGWTADRGAQEGGG